MELLEEIKLSNGLTLKIFDLSRSIATATVKVELSMQIKINLETSFFADTSDYDQVKNIFGEELTYRHKAERIIVPKENEDAVRKELLNTFKNNLLGYLSAANFSQKLALSMLRDIKENPYKYNPHIYADAEK
ncbi:MAG: hypothetical protein WCO53_11540 [Deltaproteobacteria bacterium]